MQKGHTLEYLLNLSDDAKYMMIASMELYAEYENEKLKLLFSATGGLNA